MRTCPRCLLPFGVNPLESSCAKTQSIRRFQQCTKGRGNVQMRCGREPLGGYGGTFLGLREREVLCAGGDRMLVRGRDQCEGRNVGSEASVPMQSLHGTIQVPPSGSLVGQMN